MLLLRIVKSIKIGFLKITWSCLGYGTFYCFECHVLSSAKAIWESIRETYFMDKNVSQAYEVYQNLFLLQQTDKSLTEYYTLFKGLMDELNQYHPLTNDIEGLKQQQEKF